MSETEDPDRILCFGRGCAACNETGRMTRQEITEREADYRRDKQAETENE